MEEAGIPISLITSDSLEPQANNVAETESVKPSEEELLKEKTERESLLKKIAEENERLRKNLHRVKYPKGRANAGRKERGRRRKLRNMTVQKEKSRKNLVRKEEEEMAERESLSILNAMKYKSTFSRRNPKTDTFIKSLKTRKENLCPCRGFSGRMLQAGLSSSCGWYPHAANLPHLSKGPRRGCLLRLWHSPSAQSYSGLSRLVYSSLLADCQHRAVCQPRQ